MQAARRVQQDPANDPYLDKIKYRGGAYAIMLAFHDLGVDHATKRELQKAMEKHCDDPVEVCLMLGPRWNRSHFMWWAT